MTALDPATYRYRVDAADVLVWVNDPWLAFARENGAADLTAAAVIGSPLWRFVEGEAVRQVYQAFHARLRLDGNPAVFPFRCDSPLLQRAMRLTITPEAAGHLLYESVVVRVEPRPYLGLLDPERPHNDTYLTLCSGCKRALLEPTGWLALDEVSARLRLFEQEHVPRLRHSFCPECAHAVASAPGDGNAA